MTGFGKVTAELPSKKVTVEVKALNSKQLDLSTRIPSIYKDKEMQIRSQLLQSLERGKVDFSIYIEYRCTRRLVPDITEDAGRNQVGNH